MATDGNPIRTTSRKVIDLKGGEFLLENLYGEYEFWDDQFVGNPDDVIIQFEAKAANDITVLISSDKLDTTSGIYEIVIGGWKNTKSTIRTEIQGIERASNLSPGMCTKDEFIPYWIGLLNGQIGVGTGERPGFNKILAWKNPQHDPQDAQPCWLVDFPLLLS